MNGVNGCLQLAHGWMNIHQSQPRCKEREQSLCPAVVCLDAVLCVVYETLMMGMWSKKM